ncbi:MAG: HAD-IC family P-type ATPase [Coriobacteriia bacterium]|nr:HAD-IC family P-type ATPase [Coriobacteriia bacterium]
MDTSTETQTPAIQGLTSAEVAARVAEGKVNANADVRTRTIPQIVRDNICTLFNLINIVLAVAIFWTGAYRNLLFMAIIICNIVIGIYQEVRSKQTIDRLSVITQAKAHVLRDGTKQEIALDQIVLDDVISLSRGDQVPSDCVCLDGKCSCNESLLTGESDLMPKSPGDELYSGSFVSAGAVVCRVTAVGADNYATRINNAAKVYKKTVSGIMDALRFIIKLSTCLIIPLGILMFCKEMFLGAGNLSETILRTSAALVGMIPQGFILLTSAVLAVSVMRLAQHKVLVQDLYCVETLARVDVVCLDKTGTITTGEMEVDELIPLQDATYDDALHALVAIDSLTKEDHLNETSKAIRRYLAGVQERPDAPPAVAGVARVIPFSSEHKYSGVCFGSEAGNYVLGAAEFVLKGSADLPDVQATISRLAGIRRVLVVAKVDDFDAEDTIIGTPQPLALLFIRDVVRATAPQTLQYFADQGVRVNIISGDSVETVSNIAASVGVLGADQCVDMSTVTTDEEVARVAKECRVFGRVSPDQKRKLVLALQDQGHTVAMTGDGVNDVLALHASDCSVAMGSGSAAARNVAKLILMDDDFASLPHVVAEGRRSINNLQRSGALFLVKTLFNAALAFLFLFIQGFSYPFITIQMSLIDAFTIGLPSFVLALEPNKERIRGDFLRNIITKAIPGSISVVLVVVISCILSHVLGLSQSEFSTLCVLLTVVSGLNMIVRLSIPFNPIRVCMMAVCVAGLCLGVFVFGDFFRLAPFSMQMIIITLVLVVVVSVVFNIMYNIAQSTEDKYLASLKEE